ncbi:hypothetical protein [Bradyrhizobium sp. LTSP885]|uniref:hypothetical protein n=1 Tax=Bradyrhizobium sp. LTSP885 TaxID=1619232 RepID=UPI000AE045D5|nr:hypothetical protein [Bradyrhizobium sp. LTSP885]
MGPTEGIVGRATASDFYAEADARLLGAPFVAGYEFSVDNITAVVTIDFAARSACLPIADETTTLRRE